MEPEIFDDTDKLAEALKARFAGAAVIGIDGWTGVGKTTLAKSLADKVGGSTFDLDSALDRDQKAYVSAMRLDEVCGAIAQSNGLLLVSGVCLREILNRAQCQIDAHIYIKRMATWGWADEDELDGGSLSAIGGSSGGDALRKEMRLYHQLWSPHLKADFVFQWYD